jgi:hypothetical protein
MRRAAAALAVAIAVHALALLVVCEWYLAVRDDGADEPAPIAAPSPVDDVTVVALAPDVKIPELAVAGPADELGQAQTHPLPNAQVDLPGERAADAGGGARPGDTAFAERRDRADDDALRHELWNDKPGHQAAHERSGRAKSPEAIHRDPHDALGDRPVAPDGHAASRGDARDRGGGVAKLARGSDPIAGATKPADPGASRANPTPVMTDPGPHATDTRERAATASDSANAAAASHERAPGPYEIAPPSAGGSAPTGVAGAAAPGQLANARGSDTAATTANARPGPRDLTVTAQPQDSYFRALFARLDKAIIFPHDLALDLRSGRPIATFTIRADGTIADIALEVPSLPGFNQELLRALATLKRLPPPPASLLAGQPVMRVRIEWAFDAGILR